MNFWDFANNHPVAAFWIVAAAGLAAANILPPFKFRWKRTPSCRCEEAKKPEEKKS